MKLFPERVSDKGKKIERKRDNGKKARNNLNDVKKKKDKTVLKKRRFLLRSHPSPETTSIVDNTNSPTIFTQIYNIYFL